MAIPKAYKGYGLAATSYLMQAGGAICSKALIDVSSTEATAVAWFVNGTVISFLILQFGRGGVNWASIRRNLSVYLPISLIMGFGSIGWFAGIMLAGPGLVAFVQQLATVIGVLMGAFLLGERLTLLDGAGAAVAISGALIITYQAEQAVFLGIVTALANTFALAMQNFLVKRNVERIDNYELIFVRSVTASIVVPIFFLALGTFDLPDVWLLPAFFVSVFFGYILFNLLVYFSLAYADLAKVSVLRVLTPPLSMIGAYIFFGTVPTRFQVVGGILILIGVSVILAQPLLAQQYVAYRTARGE